MLGNPIYNSDAGNTNTNSGAVGNSDSLIVPQTLSRSSSNTAWMTIPAIMTHDPPLTPSPPSSQYDPTAPPPLPPKKNNQFLSRLTNLIRRGPPPKPHLVHKWPSVENSYTFSYENPAYGGRVDAFPSSLSLPAPPQPPQSLPIIVAPQEVDIISVQSVDGNNDDVEPVEPEKVSPSSCDKKEATDDGDNKKEGAHGNDENQVRGNWGSHLEFVLSCIGYAVGLGNVWRFPYLCYKNGGGSFLIIYWILSLTVGFPIIFLELSLGQFTSQGPTGVWNYAPVVKGLGYSMCAISAIGAIYYNVIISWALYYLFASLRAHLLWTECDYESWADYRCELPRVTCFEMDHFRASDGLCYSFEPFLAAQQQLPRLVSTYCRSIDLTTFVPCYYIVDEITRNRSTVVGYWNERLATEYNRGPQFSTEQFYFRSVLGQDGKIGSRYSATSLGPPQTWLALCLFLAWILVFLCLLNGIKSSGKVVYFTALFPYLVLGVLIGRGVTLPGAYDGIMFFLKPKFEKIQDPNVWYAAASQLFFSLAACWGGMMALSSYNKFHTNTLRDALIVTTADTLTSFIASFAIFSVIGYGSHILQKPVDEVADAGTGLAFILYPKIIDSLPGSVAWAIMFFFMLLLLGLDSEFNSMETIFTAMLDKYPKLRNNMKTKALAFAIFCTPFFLLGIPLICKGGSDLLELIDDYGPGWPVFLIGIVETLSISWFYGCPRFAKDLSAMMPWLLNGKIRAAVVPWILRIFWGILTPTMLIFILVFSFLSYEPRAKIGEEVLGWCITVFVIVWTPFFAIWVVIHETRRHKSFWLGVKSAFSSSPKWGPFLDEHRREVLTIHGDMLTAVASLGNSLDCVIDDSKQTVPNKDNNSNNGNSGPAEDSSYHGSSFDGDNGVINAGIRNSNLSIFSNNPMPVPERVPNIAMIASPSSSPLSSGKRSTGFRDMPYVSSSKASLSSRSTAV